MTVRPHPPGRTCALDDPRDESERAFDAAYYPERCSAVLRDTDGFEHTCTRPLHHPKAHAATFRIEGHLARGAMAPNMFGLLQWSYDPMALPFGDWDQ